MSYYEWWNSKQKRYMDPTSSLNVVNDLYSIMLGFSKLIGTENVIIRNCKFENISGKEFTLTQGTIFIDSIFIDFIVNITFNISDTFFYHKPRYGIIDQPGEYPIVALYKYERQIGKSNICTIQIIKELNDLPNTNYFSLGIIAVDDNLNITEIKSTSDILPDFNRKEVQYPTSTDGSTSTEQNVLFPSYLLI